MLQLDEAKQKLAEIEVLAKEAETALGVGALETELASLRKQMEAPDFWTNVEQANKVSKKAKPIEDKLEQFKRLKKRLEDAEVMIDLLEEEYDEETAEELAVELVQLNKDTSELRLKALLRGEYDANGAILSLHAGAGGTEAQDWVEMLYRMYTRWCERKKYGVRVLDLLPGEEAGIKSVTFEVEGLNAYGYLKAEKGVHRLVRISPFDASARRHTSFASLDVMPDIEDDDSDIEILPEDIRVDTYRSSGAGGQHVNKTSSAIRITHLETGFVVQCQNERSQIQNRETAMRMLRAKLIEKRESEKLQEMAEIKGEMKKIEWGSQIRSYVFHPYSLVKDHRTGVETGNVTAVMDGDIDMFINAYLAGVLSRVPRRHILLQRHGQHMVGRRQNQEAARCEGYQRGYRFRGYADAQKGRLVDQIRRSGDVRLANLRLRYARAYEALRGYAARRGEGQARSCVLHAVDIFGRRRVAISPAF